MTQGGEKDPWELDPFGEQDYDPSLAFALVAAQQAVEKVNDAEAILAQRVQSHGHHTDAIPVSARKSAQAQLVELQILGQEVADHEIASRSAALDSSEQMNAVNATLDAFNRLIGAYDELLFTVSHIATPDQAPQSPIRPALPPIEDPIQASNQIETDLRDWVDQNRRNDLGKLVVVKATPGVGKTRAMLKTAYQEQQNKQRVILGVRTKTMLIGDEPETVARMNAASPTGRVHLVVITGRGPDNCWEHKSVEAVQAHGYSPGQAICLKCDYYPDNAHVAGLPICPYYEERIRAHNLANGARQGSRSHYPIVLTTHASIIAAFGGGGGRWGGFWSADIIVMDEDPTDAMETDIALSEEQTAFVSAQPHNRAATAASALFRKAIEIGKKERSDVAARGFKAPGSKELHSHTVHSRYDSAYTGHDLHDLLERAASGLRATVGMPELAQVLRDVAEAQSFSVQPGQLVGVQSVDDINALHVPPRALGQVAEDIHRQMNHSLALRRVVYERIHGHLPQGSSLDEIMETLKSKTDVEPMSYTSRLECLPADHAKDRTHDEWRFTIRTTNDLLNDTATLVIGDAYAQKEHYEQLFRRDAYVINRVSMLHPDTTITRYLDGGCNIGFLRKGGLQEVLAKLEARMPGDVRGKRVLIYGHQELRPKVEAWMEGVAETRGIAEWAYEHWWGGRGKDEYNGWEYACCISDPVQSLSGIAHVANARAFRDSLRATDLDEKLFHGRKIQIKVGKHGVVHALSSGHPRVALEHERQNVAELTQAMHRGRPVHHGVNVIVFGEMEQSVDLVAQTRTVVPGDYRKERVSQARRKTSAKKHRNTTRPAQIVGAIDSFVSPKEVSSAIQAIVDWYGVFSPYFAHALWTAPEVVTVVLRDPLIDHGDNPPYGDAQGEPNLRSAKSPQVPGVDLIVDPLPGAPLEAVPQMGTVISRVWHPPVYWQLLGGYSLPHAIRDAFTRLAKRDDLHSTRTMRWASWQAKFKTVQGGPKPMIYFDPATSAQDALALFYEIVDNQYGPVMHGKLYRPNMQVEVPTMKWKEVPF